MLFNTALAEMDGLPFDFARRDLSFQLLRLFDGGSVCCVRGKLP